MDNLEKEREAQLEELDWTVVQKLQERGQEGGRAVPCKAEWGLTRVSPQEQEVLLRERFQEESSGTEGELHRLQEESPARSRPSGVSTVLGRLGKLLSRTLGGVVD